MPDQIRPNPLHILLVEDNPGDVRLAEEAFKEGNILSDLHVVADAEEALAFLRREADYTDSVRPDLILLDLDLPGKSGLEALEEIKADQNLRTIPVVILTASSTERDFYQTRNFQASGYVIKPLDAGRFAALAQFIKTIHDDSDSQFPQ